MIRCALTGHRELPEDFDVNAVYDALEGLVKEGCDVFYCGMAQGFDLVALDCLVALSEKYPIRIEACIPHRGQDKLFPSAEREKYHTLLSRCNEVTVLSDTYYAGCYHTRDRYMVDKADMLFAYCVKKTGGAAYTVKYAQKQGVPVRFLF